MLSDFMVTDELPFSFVWEVCYLRMRQHEGLLVTEGETSDASFFIITSLLSFMTSSSENPYSNVSVNFTPHDTMLPCCKMNSKALTIDLGFGPKLVC